MKIINILKDWRIVLYVLLIIFSIVSLLPSPKKVVLEPVNAVVQRVNDCKVSDLKSFYNCLSYFENQTVYVVTNKGLFKAKVINHTLANYTVKEEGGIPLKFGIDITGGIRVVLEPEEPVDYNTLVRIKNVLEQRLNVYGIKQVEIRIERNPLTKKNYIVVELPRSEKRLLEILQSQGKFEAYLDNKTLVFTGEDIKFICNTRLCSGITYCGRTGDKYFCNFYFQITISKKAAERLYNLIKNRSVIYDPYTGKAYVNATLDLYLDNKFVEELRIGAGLKEKPVTEVSIEGSGVGNTYFEAKENALKEMRKLQAILSASLPVKLKIVRMEKISPVLGETFLREMLFAGIAALIGVSLVIFLRYREIKASLLVIGNMLVETLSTLAVAKAIGWTLDLPSLTGIVVAIGTGVDDQIVILDEILRGEKEEKKLSIKDRIKRAFFIVISSYLAFGLAMLPLFWSGVGLLRGFAVTTLIGITIGALITRPAFARLAEILLEKKKK